MEGYLHGFQGRDDYSQAQAIQAGATGTDRTSARPDWRSNQPIPAMRTPCSEDLQRATRFVNSLHRESKTASRFVGAVEVNGH